MRASSWSVLTVLLVVSLASSVSRSRAQAEGDLAAHNGASAATLHLADVLASVQAHHPMLQAEIEAVQAALGGELQASGLYDPTLQVKGSVGPAGYYDYNLIDASVAQLTPLWGAELYAGYRLQGRKLPDYYGELETLDRGEVRAGLRIPLWKDRAIDDARAGRQRAQAGKRAAQWQRDATLLELYRGAAAAYYGWTAALLYAMLSDLPIHNAECPHATRAQRGRYRKVLHDLQEDEPGVAHALVSSLERLRPALESAFPQVELLPCPDCGEPSPGGTVCKACSMRLAVEAAGEGRPR